MIHTLFLRLSPHFTTIHPTIFHYTCCNFTSSQLNFTQLFIPHYPLIWLNPIPISYRSISPHITTLHLTTISSGSKKKEPRFACLHEAKASHSHRMWTEVSASIPHLLHKGLLVSPIQ